MIDYKLKELFKKSTLKKDFIIEWGYFSHGIDWVVEGTITNSEINYESFSLSESLCSENQLKFGCCEASEVKFRISNVYQSLKGKEIKIKIILDNNTDNIFDVGFYNVYSDVLTSNKKYRDITAYDKMKKIHDVKYSDAWYNELDFPMTMKEFREKFIVLFCGVKQEDVVLPNDDLVLERSSYLENITGNDMVKAICELNGCFGHIGRNGKFQYIFLKQDISDGIYPSDTLYPSNALYPREPKAKLVAKSVYTSCQYEDFLVKPIDKIIIKTEEDDVGTTYPKNTENAGDNIYNIFGNFLIYGKTKEELEIIAKKIYSVIKNIYYRPFSANCLGNLCVEVGDPIRLSTKKVLVEGYVLKRTIKGINVLKDDISCNGKEKYEESKNLVSSQVYALKSRTNKLTRNIQEAKSEIAEIDAELKDNYYTKTETKSEITQSTEKVEAKVSKSIKSWSTEEYDISIYGFGFPSATYSPNEYYGEYYLDQENGNVYLAENNWLKVATLDTIETELKSQISITKESIELSVEQQIRELDNELKSEILLTEESIELSVENSNKELESKIKQNAEKIELKVSKGNVSSEISLEKDTVTLAGNRLIVDSDNFKLDKDGNSDFSGNLSAPSGTIGGWKITKNGLNADGKETCITTKSEEYQATLYDGKLILGRRNTGNIPDVSMGYIDIGPYGLYSRLQSTGNYFFAIDIRKEMVYGDAPVYFEGELHASYANKNTSTNAPSLTFGEESIILRSTSSSKRYKHDVSTKLSDFLNPSRLYEINVVQYKFNNDYLDENDNRSNKDVIGLIAEDVAEKYPIAADFVKDKNGNKIVEDWNYRYMIPAMLKLIQEQKKEIEDLNRAIVLLKKKVGVNNE